MQEKKTFTKLCKACEKHLPFIDFTRSNNTNDGLEGKCKKCRLKQRPTYSFNCIVCGEEYLTKKKTSNQCCSQQCVGELRTMTSTTSVSCSTCHKSFVKKLSDVRSNNYCSSECHAVSVSKRFLGVYSSRVEVECEHCKKTISVIKSRADKYRYSFCDALCYKEGVGKTKIGKNHPLYNHEKTEEERIIGRHYYEYSVWRKEVYARDNFTCVCCGDSTSGNLIAHHLYSYHAQKSLRTELSNGVTLCNGCHKEFHTKYGYKNNTAVQFVDYLKNRNTQRVCDSIE